MLLSNLNIQVQNGFIKSIYKSEKTPSLKIYEGNNSYYCFATSQGGDVINFYKDYHRLTTSQAIDELYKLAGGDYHNISRHQKIFLPHQDQPKDFYSGLLIHEKYLYDELASTVNETYALIELKKARVKQNSKIFAALYKYCQKYFNADTFQKYMQTERMLNIETMRRYKILYIGNYYEVNNHLKKTINPEELKVSGLVNDKGNLIFAKHRIVIPYLHNNNIVYLRGRYFDDDGNTITEGAKYIGLKNDLLNVNTAKRIYNLDVLNNMCKYDRLIITEGEFDAMILMQEGAFAIAIPGTGNIPTEKILNKIKSYRIKLLFDNDAAGIMLRENIKEKLMMIGCDCEDYYLTNYKDVTDFARGLNENIRQN